MPVERTAESEPSSLDFPPQYYMELNSQYIEIGGGRAATIGQPITMAFPDLAITSRHALFIGESDIAKVFTLSAELSKRLEWQSTQTPLGILSTRCVYFAGIVGPRYGDFVANPTALTRSEEGLYEMSIDYDNTPALELGFHTDEFGNVVLARSQRNRVGFPYRSWAPKYRTKPGEKYYSEIKKSYGMEPEEFGVLTTMLMAMYIMRGDEIILPTPQAIPSLVSKRKKLEQLTDPRLIEQAKSEIAFIEKVTKFEDLLSRFEIPYSSKNNRLTVNKFDLYHWVRALRSGDVATATNDLRDYVAQIHKGGKRQAIKLQAYESDHGIPPTAFTHRLIDRNTQLVA